MNERKHFYIAVCEFSKRKLEELLKTVLRLKKIAETRNTVDYLYYSSEDCLIILRISKVLLSAQAEGGYFVVRRRLIEANLPKILRIEIFHGESVSEDKIFDFSFY